MPVPRRLVTERLVLRPWEPRDAPLLKAAVESSLPELRPWMPWAEAYPQPVERIEERIAENGRKFDAGEDYTIGILNADESEALGGTGLHPRVGPDAVEIGYWIRSDVTGRGIATEAAGALTRAAFEHLLVRRVEIRCDPKNERSAAVPRRLGYRLREILIGDGENPDGSPRDTLVWETTREEFLNRPRRPD